MKKNIKKNIWISPLKTIAAVILLLLIGFILYSGTIVLKARIQTPEIVQRILNSKEIKLDLEELSSEQVKILLMVEDPNFYNHKGIDLNTPGAGLTTITQGLVKMLFFKRFKR
ncbi:MAG: transglycosylase domain-containing protein [Candidatus Aminicenantes bacterium]|nr:transglycosylase domain-containing protein [Candidatus Aminicenantes bacterium]